MDFIDKAYEKALAGIELSKDEIIELLNIELGSTLDKKLRKTARSVAHIKCNDKGYLWCAVGADYAPCAMNCKFCSFGEKWNIIKKSRRYTKDEIIKIAHEFVKNGADYIVLRTTEFYSIPKLLGLVKELRIKIPGDYKIVFNTGELDMTISGLMVEVGVNGVYHACRLREGEDTPFDPMVRKNTMNNICRSGLDLISLVEPIGPEHSNSEIALNFLQILKYKAVISGAMARIPVPGTPLGVSSQISDSRLAQIVAVLRLAGGNTVRDICVHPASKEALDSGANIVVVETGAIPRDTKFENNNWNEISIDNAKKMLKSSGYSVGVKNG